MCKTQNNDGSCHIRTRLHGAGEDRRETTFLLGEKQREEPNTHTTIHFAMNCFACKIFFEEFKDQQRGFWFSKSGGREAYSEKSEDSCNHTTATGKMQSALGNAPVDVDVLTLSEILRVQDSQRK